MVRVDAMLVEQMRAGGLQGPFSRVELDESGTEPRLMLTVQREPTPDSVEWWRSVAAGLGVEIQKLKDLAAQAPPASDPPGPTVINEDDGDVTIDFDYANDRVVSIRLGEESSGLSAFVDGESHALCPLDRVPPKVLALLRTEAKAVTLRQSDPPGLVRYGVSPEWSSGPLLTPMEDGYWTPWHLAAQAIAARQSDPPGLVANWRPIETAPKRTDVLAGWADRPHWLPQVLQQDDAGMWFNGEESDYRPPTHWMPLPASPQAKED